MEALGVQPLLEDRRQLLLDGGFLLVALEEERHREDVERLVELGQAGGGEEPGAERLEPHLLDGRRLVPLLPVGEHGERNAAVGVLLPRVAHLEQGLVPGGTGRNERRQADIAGGRERHHREGDQGGECKSRKTGHVGYCSLFNGTRQGRVTWGSTDATETRHLGILVSI